MKKTKSWAYNIRQRLSPLSMALLIILSVIGTTLSPLLIQNASAATPDDILNRARAWSILNAVIDERGKVDSSISASDAGTCHIFGSLDNGSVYVGSHVTGNNNGLGAGQFSGADWSQLEANSGVASSALASVGISGGCNGLLEKIGYKLVNGTYEQPGDFEAQLSARMSAAVSPDAFFGAHIGDGGPGDALSYAIMIYNLKNVCGWQFRNPFSDTAEPGLGRNIQARANGATGEDAGQHYHTYTFENGGPGDNTYYKEGGRTDDINVGSKTGFANSGGNGASMDCGDNNADTFGAKLADFHKYADAYAALVGKDGTSDAGSGTAADGSAGDNKVTCVIEAIGWIVCPIMSAMAKMVDGAYLVVSGMLTVQPLVSDAGSPIYQAWSVMRNFANVAFVIAFLVIVFSQLTSVGITNYGIKKMLPRLIIAAILVNVSFWVCAIAVDLSNIIGSSVNDLLQNVAQTNITLNGTAAQTGMTGWQDLTGKVVAGTLVGGAIVVYAALSALVPALVAGLLIIVTVFIVLVIRQALIILLIVLSPLAFVAYLLPNTESLGKKWREMFQTLLLIYPIIAAIFGASALASKVLIAAGKSSPTDTPTQVIIHFALEAGGYLVTIAPLLATVGLMNLITGVAKRFGVPVPGAKFGSKLKEKAGDFRQRSESRRAIDALGSTKKFRPGYGKYRRAARLKDKTRGIETEKSRAAQNYLAGNMTDKNGQPTSFAKQVAGGNMFSAPDPGALQRALAGAKFTIEQAEFDEVKAQSATIENYDSAKLIATTKDSTNSPALIAAALAKLVKVGKADEVADAIDRHGNLGQGSNVITKTLAASLSKDGPQYLKGSDIGKIEQGKLGGSMHDVVAKNIRDGVISADKMVDVAPDDLVYASSVADTDGHIVLQKNAKKVKSTPTLAAKAKNNFHNVDELAATGSTTYVAPPL